jgi:hypothetical protein
MKILNSSIITLLFIFTACGPKAINGKMDDTVIKCTTEYKYPNSRIGKISFDLTNIMVIAKKIRDDPDKLGIMIIGSIQNTGNEQFTLNSKNYIIENDNGEIYNVTTNLDAKSSFAENINNSKPDGFICIYGLEKKIFKNKLYFSLSFPEDPNKIKIRILIYDPKQSTWDFQTFGPIGKMFSKPNWE